MKGLHKSILIRTYIIYFGMLVFGGFIVAKIIKIQYFEGDEWLAQAKESTIKVIDIQATRGSIYSSDGMLMATSMPIYDIRMDVANPNISDELFDDQIDSLAWQLSHLFGGKSPRDYRRELSHARRSGKRNYLIKRNISHTQLSELKKFAILRLGKYKGGLIIKPKTRREMPYGDLAKRTIGFSRPGTDVGLEGAYNEVLQGVSGKQVVQRIASGRLMPVSDYNLVEPQDGKDIITSIDINIQDVAETSLRNHLIENQAYHGCVVLMEVHSGRILAIANLNYDTASQSYLEDYNFAIGARTEPGSTFKLASMLVALNDGVVDLDDMIPTGNGIKKYHNRTMEDSHKGGYGTITAQQVFEKSSNVGVSLIITEAYKENPQRFIDLLYEMNLNQKLELEISGEPNPYLKDTEESSWSKVSLPWMSIGYELLVTPLQTLALYNAVANDGVMVKPRMVDAIVQHGVIVEEFQTEIINRKIASKSTIKKAQQMLEGVVQSGTARNLKNPIYTVAGKTGTAQVAVRNKGYDKKNYQASFVGYYPADNPQYSCIVLVQKKSAGKIYGSSVAAPVFKEIADKIYAQNIDIHVTKSDSLSKTYQPPPAKGSVKESALVMNELTGSFQINVPAEWTKFKNVNDTITYLPLSVEMGKIPDVRGLNAKDAIFLLEQNGFKVVMKGKGLVKKQSIGPGTEANINTTVYLDLSS